MSDIDIENESDNQSKIEDAYGAIFVYRGQTLEPFSIQRQLCYERLVSLGLSRAEGSAAVIYLCTLKTGIEKDTIKAARRGERLLAMMDKIHEWMGKQGFTIHGNNVARKEADEVSDAIWDNLNSSEFVPEFREKGSSSGNA